MKKSYYVVLIVTTMLAGVSAFARGGGGIPSPFVETSNRKVELADGEMYTLQGKIVFDSNDTPWFWVDLAKHPWLANQKRQAAPYYRLQGLRDQWRPYNEKSVQLICFAHTVMSGMVSEIQISEVTEAGSKAITERDRERDH